MNYLKRTFVLAIPEKICIPLGVTDKPNQRRLQIFEVNNSGLLILINLPNEFYQA